MSADRSHARREVWHVPTSPPDRRPGSSQLASPSMPEVPGRSYLVCATARCGSTMLCSHLGLPNDGPLPEPRTFQQADDLSDEWVERFLAESSSRTS